MMVPVRMWLSKKYRVSGTDVHKADTTVLLGVGSIWIDGLLGHRSS
ncbi:MAG: hypothetical protein GTO54_05280 [Nitrososphaeria archaeon]|nr:hypothetical protein [Nitrososphaeria archaeon]